jgi:hypothetical protein
MEPGSLVLDGVLAIHLLEESDLYAHLEFWPTLPLKMCSDGEYLFARGRCWNLLTENVLCVFFLDGQTKDLDGNTRPVKDWYALIKTK